MLKRLQKFNGRHNETAFLWGARQTGKSTLLKQQFPESTYYDLLLSEEFERFTRKPSLLREEILAAKHKPAVPVIIDEVQRIPGLLNEIQWLIVNKNISFILCGSSARKLIRSGGNLLGGRALKYELFPLVSEEIPDFNLDRALNHGLIPRHYLSNGPGKMLSAYIGSYLKEEITAEALVRKVPSFTRFLESSAFSNGEIVNYQNIARDTGVSSPTVKEYFQILEDTLVARYLHSFQKRPKRRVILAPKFYYFDVAVANYLLNRGHIAAKSEAFGKAFEHLIYQEIWAHSKYSGLEYPVNYWRTTSQLEVDFILGDHQVAVEVKSTDMAQSQHFRGLRAFSEEYKTKELILVTQDPRPRKVGNINILPWRVFLSRLWAGEII
ncbi:MAG: AAA family ATPase [Elusimicrobiota bacterium]